MSIKRVKNMRKSVLYVVFLSLITVLGFSFIPPEEGMYPLSELKSIDLVGAGLKISPEEIYNPGSTGLVDALVLLGGCTGSFISEEGLMITNHHCAFRSINEASTTENNYLANGFAAQTREAEIPAKGYTCRITESYKDISDEILSAVKEIKDNTERSSAINKKIKTIEEKESDPTNSIEAKVSEMFIGKTYVLFK